MRDWLVGNKPDWTEAFTRPSRYVGSDVNLYDTVQAPWPSAEGYRVIRCRSSAKIDYDAEARRGRITAIDELNQRFLSPKIPMKEVVAIEAAAPAALEATSSSRWMRSGLQERAEVRMRLKPRGRPGADTQYRPTPFAFAIPRARSCTRIEVRNSARPLASRATVTLRLVRLILHFGPESVPYPGPTLDSG